MVFEKAVDGEGKKLLVAMPGVPHEMKTAMEEQVIGLLGERREARGEIIHRTLMVRGIAESTLALHIEDWESALPATMHLAYLPQNGTIRLRLSTYGEASAEEVEAQIEALKPLVKEWLLGDEVIM